MNNIITLAVCFQRYKMPFSKLYKACKHKFRDSLRSCSHSTLSSFLVSYLPLCLSPSLCLCLATLALLPPSFLPLNLSLAQELLFREISTTPKTTAGIELQQPTNENRRRSERPRSNSKKATPTNCDLLNPHLMFTCCAKFTLYSHSQPKIMSPVYYTKLCWHSFPN